MDTRATVTFFPSETRVEVQPPATVLDAALAAGIFIPAQCGGSGTCGRCAVRIRGAVVESRQSLAVLGRERYAAGFRLACAVNVAGDMEVEVPAGTARAIPAIGRGPAAGRFIRPDKIVPEGDDQKPPSDPPFERLRLRLPSPTPEDNGADLARLVSGIKRETGDSDVSVSLPLLGRLPGALRENGWDVTALLIHRGHDMGGRELAGIGPAEGRGPYFAVAVDVGTTTLWVSLLDLETGREAAHAWVMNPQRSCGADVISRIVYAQKPGGAQELQRLVVEAVDRLIGDLLAEVGADRSAVTHVVVAGNSVMSHLLLGLETRYLREAPYVPAAKVYPDIPASEVGLSLGPAVPLFVFPSVASYVGGDIVSGVLASGLFRDQTVTLFIDIGTNGEIVLGNDQWMLTASASAGPAFEGGGVRFGMSASPGAIEGFAVGGDCEPMITTIEKRPPVGICGSGIINVLAGLFIGGLVDHNGKIKSDLDTPRVREGESGREYVVVWAADSGIDEDIVITDVDIENVIRAKAAMFAGYHSLMAGAGIGPADIGRVIISGAFGNVLDIENAVTIGLFPDIDRDRFVFIGNGSLAGARLAALSRSRFREGLVVARSMTNVELSVDPAYMDRYLAAVFLPHTDIDLFPTVKRTLTARSDAPGEGASAL